MSTNNPNMSGLLMQAASHAVEHYNALPRSRRESQSPPRSRSFQSRYTYHENTPTPDSYINDRLDAIIAIFYGIISRFKQLFYISLLSGFLFLSALITYGFIYWLIMPANYAKIPIYFDYNSFDQMNDLSLNHPPSLSSINEENTYCTTSSSMCKNMQESSFSSITGTIDLLSQNTQWYPNPDLTDKAKLSSSPPSFLTSNKKYFVNVMLVLPESQINTDVGMFMVHVNLYSPSASSSYDIEPTTHAKKNYTLLAYSKRSAMLPYESFMVGFVRKLILMGPMILGIFPEAKKVEVKSFDHFIEEESNPLSLVRVQIIVPNDIDEGEGFSRSKNLSLQILSAELHIGKELNILQVYMKEWFYSCAFFGIFFLMIFQGVFYFFFQLWRTSCMSRDKDNRTGRGHNERSRRHFPRHQDASDDEHSGNENEKSEEENMMNEEASQMFMNMNMKFDEDNSNNWEEMSIASDRSDNPSVEVSHKDDVNESEVNKRESVNIEEDEIRNNNDISTFDSKSKEKTFIIPMKRKNSSEEVEKLRAEKIMKGPDSKFDSQTSDEVKTSSQGT